MIGHGKYLPSCFREVDLGLDLGIYVIRLFLNQAILHRVQVTITFPICEFSFLHMSCLKFNNGIRAFRLFSMHVAHIYHDLHDRNMYFAMLALC